MYIKGYLNFRQLFLMVNLLVSDIIDCFKSDIINNSPKKM